MLQILRIRNVLTSFKTPDQFIRYYNRHTVICDTKGTQQKNGGKTPSNKKGKCKNKAEAKDKDRKNTIICGTPGSQSKNVDSKSTPNKSEIQAVKGNKEDNKTATTSASVDTKSDGTKQGKNKQQSVSAKSEEENVRAFESQVRPRDNIESLYDLLKADKPQADKDIKSAKVLKDDESCIEPEVETNQSKPNPQTVTKPTSPQTKPND